MTKLAIIGAGSTVFTKKIITDIFLNKELENVELALMDIDKVRLKSTYNVIKFISEKLNKHNKIKLYDNQKEALIGADFVQTTFQVGGYKPSTIIDFEIPKKYGLKQTIADTIGIGGIMRGLRTIPVLNAICQDIMNVCPKAILMQYVNPMCINMIALNKKFPEIQSVGLCHSVQGTAKMIADDLNINLSEVDYDCVGINHLAFFTKFEKKLPNGKRKDLYPALKSLAKKILNNEEISTRTKKKDSESNKYLHEKVRYELLNRFGYFVTESSEHFAEYVPWFIKNNKDYLIEEYKIPIDEYIDRCENYENLWKNHNQNLSKDSISELKKSNEYAVEIIKAFITNKSFEFNGNVFNNNLITNLPQDCVVEVPCKINSEGINSKKIGKIPLQLSALMQTNINVQLLTAEAALTKKKDLIYQASLLDPHTAAELSINEIYDMVDDLLEAHNNYLPTYY